MQKSKIIDANRELGKHEARYYDLIHSEIFNKKEQKRLNHYLDVAIRLVNSKNKTALDIGAGTGNLTLKLLERGFTVTAVDISQEYLDVLAQKAQKFIEEKQLTIICSDIEKIDLPASSFDFIGTYSTLHHFPDYEQAVELMCKLLKPNGVIYLDHETSDSYWKHHHSKIVRLYDLSCGFLNRLYLFFSGFKIKEVNKFKHLYSTADFHTKEDDHVNHNLIKNVLKKYMRLIGFKKYVLNRTRIWNHFKIIYRFKVGNDTLVWLGQKKKMILDEKPDYIQ